MGKPKIKIIQRKDTHSMTNMEEFISMRLTMQSKTIENLVAHVTALNKRLALVEEKLRLQTKNCIGYDASGRAIPSSLKEDRTK
jgi:uncharacterized coiled-coil protein SlyX